MTRKQHLEAAARFGRFVMVGSKLSLTERDTVLEDALDSNSILAGHHANAAMACRCSGDYRPLCPHCAGRGWLRAEDIP